MWNVYVDSSWTFFQSLFLAGCAACMGPCLRGADAEAMVRESFEMSSTADPRRTIFLLLRVESAWSVMKGGLSVPILGVIMNFWFEGGMERASATWLLRSVRVASAFKDIVNDFPWCCIEISTLSSEDS